MVAEHGPACLKPRELNMELNGTDEVLETQCSPPGVL